MCRQQINLDNLKIIGSYKKKKKLDKYELIFSDIETELNNENIHQVRCISYVLGEKVKSFINLEDYFNDLKQNHRKSIIYFHNFGRFDSTFIIKYLVDNKNIGEISVIVRNNIVYEVQLKRYNIIFRDSLLLIPMNLYKLSENFCKNYFKNIDYEYTKRLSLEETIKQCELDCKVLQEGFLNFRNIIKANFNIDVKYQLTIPSLSFNIFKKDFYNPSQTPITKNPYNVDEFIRRSYKGGVAEVYKPKLENGYCYDANSLYPFIMKNFKFPVGKPKFINGEEIDLNKFIGFLECEVQSDEDIDFLTYKHPVRGLITPKGSWIEVYHHLEVKKAIELGYKIKILKGLKYEKEEYIFGEFVDKLYKMRLNATSKEINLVIKLLLNSLYGRFGMKTLIESTKYISGQELKEYKTKYDISDAIFLGNDTYIVVGKKKIKSLSELYNNTIDTETAVQIASCVTAGARLYMYDFKKIPGNECYYTDTDSIFLKNQLDEKYIGNNLGEFKLEYEIKEAYFIAPKVYYVKKSNNEEKIVMKGVKPEEYKNTNMKEIFKNIVLNEDGVIKTFIFTRINLFKRFFNKILIGKQDLNIIFNFPFNKRKKILKDNLWVDTEAIKLRSK